MRPRGSGEELGTSSFWEGVGGCSVAFRREGPALGGASSGLRADTAWELRTGEQEPRVTWSQLGPVMGEQPNTTVG